MGEPKNTLKKNVRPNSPQSDKKSQEKFITIIDTLNVVILSRWLIFFRVVWGVFWGDNLER
jgi:hypothetical protein